MNLIHDGIFIFKNKKTGGNVWESNPPKRLLTPHTSFED